MFFLKKQSNYEQSNAITAVKMPISPSSRQLAGLLLQSTEAEYRQELSEQLLDELSDLAAIDIVEIAIVDKNQEHRRRDGRIVMKKYGSYRIASKLITINNLTAARGQIVAPKTFLDTLLHEWLHHYDFQKLRINSIHSAGFYRRLSDLKIKLKIS